MMIDTLHLLPPDLGPRSNPMLYGVAEAIAALFPPVMLASSQCDSGSQVPCAIASADEPMEAVAGD